MKRIFYLCATTAACLFATAAFATQVGPYIGIGAGKGYVETPDNYAFDTTGGTDPYNSQRRIGFAARGFFGYNINPYLGIEGGYTKYSRSIYVGQADGYYSSIRYYFHTYDAVAKLYLPIADTGFNAYILGGYTRVVESVNFVDNGVPLSGAIVAPPTGTSHGYNNRPIYGGGFNFYFGHHFVTNIEFTRVQKLGTFSHNSHAIPFLDLLTLNFAYNFC